MKKLLFIISFFILGTNLHAQDFYSISNGDTLLYNIISNTEPYTAELIIKAIYPSSPSLYKGDIIIPDSVLHNNYYYKVISIGDNAFYNSSELTSIRFPNNLISIGNNAFMFCLSLDTIILPNTLEYIGHNGFSGCLNISSIKMSENLSSVGEYAFHSRRELESISLPSSLTYISKGMFIGCQSLKTVSLPKTLELLSCIAFSDCVSLSSINIPEKINFIGDMTFNNCTSLDTVFYNPVKPSIMGKDSNYVFNNCDNFKTLVIGSKVESIPEPGFYNIKTINKIIIESPKPPIINETTFHGLDKNIDIITPCGTLSEYQSSNIWNTFVNIQSIKELESPKGLELVNNPNSLELKWEADALNYEIYRNDSLIATENKTSFIDKDIKHGMEYCYKIKSINNTCESDFSETLCKSYVGINDIEDGYSEIKLYPNPSNGQVTLITNGLDKNSKILIYDIQGRYIKTYNIQAREKNLLLDLTQYPKGIYQLKIINPSLNKTLKLILQ